MKSRILFVGDLDDLPGSLDRMHCQWDMAFIQNGTDALETLSKGPFDVVVADMQISGITSSDFFNQISEQYPQIIRVMLLGTDGQASLIQAAAPVHQWLPKPCDPDLLEAKVARAFSLRRILMNETLMSCVSKMKSLPSPPALYFDIMKALGSGIEKVMTRVGELISEDIGMTAKVLQVVNSAHFGLRMKASNPIQAAKMLGPTTIKALVLASEVFSQFEQIQIAGTSFEKLLHHSQVVGSFARKIAEIEGEAKSTAEDAFLAGILHDTGKLILASNSPEQYTKVASLAAENDMTIWQAEQEMFGATHAEMGAYLLGLWGMSDSIVEALAFHHRPTECLEAKFGLVTAVHVANVLEAELHEGSESKTSTLDEDYLAELNMANRLSIWRQSCHEQVDKVSFSMGSQS